MLSIMYSNCSISQSTRARTPRARGRLTDRHGDAGASPTRQSAGKELRLTNDDLADPRHRRQVGVVRHVRHDVLGVRAESGLKRRQAGPCQGCKTSKRNRGVGSQAACACRGSRCGQSVHRACRRLLDVESEVTRAGNMFRRRLLRERWTSVGPTVLLHLRAPPSS